MSFPNFLQVTVHRACVPTGGGRVPTAHLAVGIDRELKPNFTGALQEVKT